VNNNGIMGYRTPNIDRIAKEGATSPTGTASRAARPGARAFITGSRRSAPA
jgi:arylsulfatase